MNWFYEFLPAELQTRIFAHVLGLTLGDRNDMISLWQYRHAPQRTRAECLALELKRLAGLLGRAPASPVATRAAASRCTTGRRKWRR